MNSQEFDDIIKNKAQNRRADVPDDMWENIAGKKKRRRFPFFWLLFLSLLLTGIIVVPKLANTNDKNISLGKNDDQHLTTGNGRPVTERHQVENNDQRESSSGITTSEKNNNIAATTVVDIDRNKPDQNVVDRATTNGTITDDIVVKMSDNDHASAKTTAKYSAKKNSNSDLKNKNSGNEDVFSHYKKSKTTKGKFKVTISGSQTEENTDDIKEDELSTATVIVQHKSTDKFTSTDKTVSISTNDINDVEREKVSLINKSDSIKEKQHTSTVYIPKKEKRAAKKTTLKIEFAVTQVLPTQQYQQPGKVTRTIVTPDMRSEFISENIKSSVESGTGYSIALVKPIGKRWSLSGGIQYLRFTERLQFTGIETNTDNSDVHKNKTIIDARNAYYQVSVPLSVRYSFINNRNWTASFTTGAFVDVSRKYHNDLRGNFETVYASGTFPATSKTSLGVDLFAGIHFTGSLWKRYEWFAEPAFRYNFTRYNLNSVSFNKRVNKPGISLGVAYRFGK